MAKQDAFERDVLKWYNHNKYNRLGNDVTVTELLNPPQLVHLRNRYRDQIVDDSLETILPSLIGIGSHDVVQSYLRNEGKVSGDWMIERHMLGIINGVRVSGRFDALHKKETLYDIKVTRVWKYIFGGKEEWEQQLNFYAFLLSLDGIFVKNLRVAMLLLDWQEGKVMENGYPSSRVQMVPIKLWPLQVTEQLLSERVKAWSDSETLSDAQLPNCSPEERWADKEVFKLYRHPKLKRATKNFDTEQRAEAYLETCQDNDPKKWKDAIIKRFQAKEWKRCEKWCQVSKWCHQYQNR